MMTDRSMIDLLLSDVAAAVAADAADAADAAEACVADAAKIDFIGMAKLAIKEALNEGEVGRVLY
jgi:hypothetical protein